MPDENWVQHLSELVVLAGCAYMSAPSKPRLANVPSVREPASSPTQQKPRKKVSKIEVE